MDLKVWFESKPPPLQNHPTRLRDDQRKNTWSYRLSSWYECAKVVETASRRRRRQRNDARLSSKVINKSKYRKPVAKALLKDTLQSVRCVELWKQSIRLLLIIINSSSIFCYCWVINLCVRFLSPRGDTINYTSDWLTAVDPPPRDRLINLSAFHQPPERPQETFI